MKPTHTASPSSYSLVMHYLTYCSLQLWQGSTIIVSIEMMIKWRLKEVSNLPKVTLLVNAKAKTLSSCSGLWHPLNIFVILIYSSQFTFIHTTGWKDEVITWLKKCYNSLSFRLLIVYYKQKTLPATSVNKECCLPSTQQTISHYSTWWWGGIQDEEKQETGPR